MMTLLRKGVQALTLLLVGVMLSAIGFVAGADVQSPATLQNLRLFFILAPLFFIILGELAAYRFRITPETHRLMMAEIERLREGGDRATVDPEAKRVCEQLTGFSYDQLYR
jgi:oligogalacturonide transporter